MLGGIFFHFIYELIKYVAMFISKYLFCSLAYFINNLFKHDLFNFIKDE